jgi:hypothetical protein
MGAVRLYAFGAPLGVRIENPLVVPKKQAASLAPQLPFAALGTAMA